MNKELSSQQIVYGSRRQYVERAPNLGMGHHGQHKCWSISNVRSTSNRGDAATRRDEVLHAEHEKSAVDGAGGRPRQPRDECHGRHRLHAAEHGRRAPADVLLWSDKGFDDEERALAQVHDLEGIESRPQQRPVAVRTQGHGNADVPEGSRSWKRVRQGSRWVLDWKKSRPGEVRWLLDLDGLQVRHGERRRGGAPTRHKTRYNEGEFHKHHDDPNKPPTPRKPPPPLSYVPVGMTVYDRDGGSDAFREFEALLDRDAKSRRRPQSAPAARR